MSHFSTINTKLKSKTKLVEALQLLQYDVTEDVMLENPLDHEHKQWQVDVAVGNDIGFRLNKEGVYELVSDIQTWKLPIPPKRFLEKVTQSYAKVSVVDAVQQQGFTVVTESKSVDNTIEIVAEKW